MTTVSSSRRKLNTVSTRTRYSSRPFSLTFSMKVWT